DDCGRTITHTQTITIDPVPPATFTNAPDDITLTCEEAETLVISDLTYTNNETGACEISGSVPGDVTGSFDECGGELVVNWTFTDECGRTITHTQTITIDPAAPAVFENAPVDLTLTCTEAET